MSATAALSAGAVATLATGKQEFLALSAGLAIAVAAPGAGRRPAEARVPGLVHLGAGPKGFIIGLALTILVGQLPKLFGIEKGEGNFFSSSGI